MVNEVTREVVSVGIDFSPIPVDIGDGVIWKFHPDPDPAVWDNLQTVLMGFQQTQDVSDEDAAQVKIKPLLEKLHGALGQLLLDKEQKDKWAKTSYGLLPLQRLAQVIMEQLTGFPTNQPSQSGKG